MCDVKDCDNDASVIVESGHFLCEDHVRPTKLVCRFCHVDVVSREDLRPILGRSHAKSCPRHLKYG